MPEVKAPTGIKDYADGWITERTGTDVPAFLKFAYIVIAAGSLAYFFMFMNGEVNHSDRGFLVRQMNQATQTSPAFMYFVVALILICSIVIVIFAFGKVHEE
jgi:hypothetical protein